MAYIENIYIKEVTHIGFLDDATSRKPSLDGAGISVTTKPESWRAIRGLNGPEFTLIFPTAQWVDAMTFGDDDIEDIKKWAVKEGYLRETTGWFAVVASDQEAEVKIFPTQEEAARAIGRTLDEEILAISNGHGGTWADLTFKISPRGMKQLERWPGNMVQWEQAAISLYIRKVVVPKRPYVVGIWWSEPDNVEAGCAPSGILFPERLHLFEVEDEEGEVMSFNEKFPNFNAPVDPLVAYA